MRETAALSLDGRSTDALAGRPSRRLILLGLTATTGLVILATARLVDTSDLLGTVVDVLIRPELLLPFLAFYTLAFWLRAMAWQELLTTKGRTFDLFSILMASLSLNHLLPAKVGDAARVYLLTRRETTMGPAVVSTALARILDFASLLAIAAAGGFIAAGRAPGGAALLIPPVPVAGGAAALFLIASPWSERLVARLPAKGVAFARQCRSALRQAQGGPLVRAFLLTTVSWLLESVVLLVAARALGVDLSIAAAMAVTAFTLAFQAVQVTPGGLGVYEATMTGALATYGVDADTGLLLATSTHALKFLYSYAVGLPFLAREGAALLRSAGFTSFRGTLGNLRAASRLEIVAARLWNVLNEGKTFTPVFVLSVFLAVNVPHWAEGAFWLRALVALALTTPLFLTFYRFGFPLRLRAFLWVFLAASLVAFRFVDLTASAALLGAYVFFTVFLWGSLYYHLRIGTPLTNFTRFWRLVLENPDSTSGNFLEQVPKGLLLINLLQFVATADEVSAERVAAVLGLGLALGLASLLVHQWFFTWRPALPTSPTNVLEANGRAVCQRFIAIIIDGCRADRLEEARTPNIDRLRAEGTEFVDMRTVYPARTVTCFSSMLTGAPPKVHGMRSNFVPSLGVKCDSVFSLLRRHGRLGRLVGIAHLVDAFGEEDVKTVSAVMKNEEVDGALLRTAQRVLRHDAPDFLVLQFIRVDQTGHARGSYNRDYLDSIEATDALIGQLLDWLDEQGMLQDTTLLITADHGQGRGIGGHGHLGPGELNVPCIFWGAGVDRGRRFEEPRSIVDVAPTIAHFLGLPPPQQSVGRVLLPPGQRREPEEAPVVVVVPAHNEDGALPAVLAAIPSSEELGAPLRVVVVDDGSTDRTAEAARSMKAEVIVHERNRGLGAGLRSGLHRARDLGARAAVYLDADGEYDAREIPRVLAPILAGEADYVLGSRFRGTVEGMSLTRRVGNAALSAGLSLLAGRLISDGQTGFRAFSRRALEVAEIVHDYNYAQVLTLDLLRKGMRLAQVPVSYRRRTQGKSFIRYHQYLWKVVPAVVREVLSD
ncbi:MAG: hypothetical protein A2V88_15860 [Elusimicrobia bacterium RBG_16_66_12]|nr:MAG: hypothetical protein A2V88_15860 [Elusimicrobia bacterium RBG_16_66_12]